MKPSSAMGTRLDAPPRITPTSPAISKPPTLASTSRPSRGSGAFTDSARATMSTLRASAASSTPVPRPVTRSGGAPVIAAVIALAAVVLPIPISPVPRRSAPASIAARASRAPVSMALTAWARVIAGPRAMLAVPGAIGQATSSDARAIGFATPKSATITRAPACRASTLTAAPPLRKFSTICAVTTWGYALTPSATTPWSAANVKMTGRRTLGAPPRSTASRRAISSSRPRLPGGFVRPSRWRCASAARPGGRAPIELRRLESTGVRPAGPRRRGHGLQRDGKTRDHQHDAIARGGDLLIHEAEQVAKTDPDVGLGMHTLAHLVGDERQRERAAPDQRGERLGLLEQRHLAVAAQEPVRDPEGEAVHDHRVVGARESRQMRHEVVGLLDRGPVARALGPVALDPSRHVAVRRARGRHEGDAPAEQRVGDGEAALAAAGSAENEERWRQDSRVLPRRPVPRCVPGQVSWLSDRPTPRAFPASRPVAFAGFVPDYSDGVAAAFNRLPWALRGSRTRTTR